MTLRNFLEEMENDTIYDDPDKEKKRKSTIRSIFDFADRTFRRGGEQFFNVIEGVTGSVKENLQQLDEQFSSFELGGESIPGFDFGISPESGILGTAERAAGEESERIRKAKERDLGPADTTSETVSELLGTILGEGAAAVVGGGPVRGLTGLGIKASGALSGAISGMGVASLGPEESVLGGAASVAEATGQEEVSIKLNDWAKNETVRMLADGVTSIAFDEVVSIAGALIKGRSIADAIKLKDPQKNLLQEALNDPSKTTIEPLSEIVPDNYVLTAVQKSNTVQQTIDILDTALKNTNEASPGGTYRHYGPKESIDRLKAGEEFDSRLGPRRDASGRTLPEDSLYLSLNDDLWGSEQDDFAEFVLSKDINILKIRDREDFLDALGEAEQATGVRIKNGLEPEFWAWTKQNFDGVSIEKHMETFLKEASGSQDHDILKFYDTLGGDQIIIHNLDKVRARGNEAIEVNRVATARSNKLDSDMRLAEEELQNMIREGDKVDATTKRLAEQGEKLEKEAAKQVRTRSESDAPFKSSDERAGWIALARSRIIRGGSDKILPGSAEELVRRTRRAYQYLVDHKLPFTRIGRSFEGSITDNPTIWARNEMGAPFHAWTSLRLGVLGVGEVTPRSRGIEEIVSEVDNVKKLSDFLIAEHVLADYTVSEDGLMAGFHPRSLRAMQDAGLEDPAIMKAAGEIRKFNRQLLLLLEENDVIPKGAADRVMKENRLYAPMFREDERFYSSRNMSQKERNALKRRMPSVRGGGVHDPIESMFMQTMNSYELLWRRQLMKSLMGMANDSPNNPYFKNVTDEVDPSTLNSVNEGGTLEGSLPEELLEALETKQRAGIQMFSDRSGRAIVKVREEGGENFRFYETNREMLEALTVQSPTEWKWASKAFIAAARGLRLGVTMSPVFQVRNLARDTAFTNISGTGLGDVAEILNRGGPRSAALVQNMEDTVRAMSPIAQDILGVKQDEWLTLWATSGGGFGALIDMDRAALQKTMASLQAVNHTDMFTKMRNWTNIVGRKAASVSRFSEDAPRLAEMKRAYISGRAQGMDHKEAALYAGNKAREVTVDFARRGAFFQQTQMGEFLRQSNAFLTAQIAGMDRTARLLVNPNPAIRRKAWGTAFTYFTLPAIANYAVNRWNLAYWNRPWYERAGYFLVPLPGVINIPSILRSDDQGGFDGFISNLTKPFSVGTDPTSGNETVFLRIPKAHEIGWLFMTLPTMMLEEADPANPYKNKEGVAGAFEGAKRSVEEFLGGTATSLTPITTAGKVLAENITNRSFLTGQSVQSPFQVARPSIAAATGRADPMSTMVADVSQMSGLNDLLRGVNEVVPVAPQPLTPPRAASAIRGFGGTLAGNAIDISKMVAPHISNTPPIPARPWQELPLIGDFFTHFDTQSEPSRRFREEFDRLERGWNAEQSYIDQGRPDRAEKVALSWIDSNRFLVYRKIASHTTDIFKAIKDNIKTSRTMEELTRATGIEDLVGDLPDNKRLIIADRLQKANIAFMIATFDREHRNELGERFNLTEQHKDWIDALNELDDIQEQADKDKEAFEGRALIDKRWLSFKKRVQIQRVIDGDTVELEDGTRVRLQNFFSPEIDEEGGDEARRELESIINSGVRPTLEIGSRSRDPHGRLLADIETDPGIPFVGRRGSVSDRLKSLFEEGGEGR